MLGNNKVFYNFRSYQRVNEGAENQGQETIEEDGQQNNLNQEEIIEGEQI